MCTTPMEVFSGGGVGTLASQSPDGSCYNNLLQVPLPPKLRDVIVEQIPWAIDFR